MRDVAILHSESVVLEALCARAEAALAAGDPDSAIDAYMRAVVMAKGFPVPAVPGQLFPRDDLVAACQSAIAAPFLAKGANQDAFEYLDAALKHFRASPPPSDLRLLAAYLQAEVNQAAALHGLGKHQLARAALDRAVELLPLMPGREQFEPPILALASRVGRAIASAWPG